MCKLTLFRSVCYTVTFLSLSSCDWWKGRYVDVADGLDMVKNEVNQIVSDPQRSVEEVKKLGQFEYRIVELELSTSSVALEKELNVLGKERWDCHILNSAAQESYASNLRLLCKRQPFTPLRYFVK